MAWSIRKVATPRGAPRREPAIDPRELGGELGLASPQLLETARLVAKLRDFRLEGVLAFTQRVDVVAVGSAHGQVQRTTARMDLGAP